VGPEGVLLKNHSDAALIRSPRNNAASEWFFSNTPSGPT